MKKGFTLCELFIAAAILITALCGIMVGFTTCILLNESSRNLTRAISHAEYVMEDIKNSKFDDIVTKINNGDWDCLPGGLTALDNEFIDTSVIDADPDPLEATLLEVTVTVDWKDRGLRDRDTSLRTLIAEQQ